MEVDYLRYGLRDIRSIVESKAKRISAQAGKREAQLGAIDIGALERIRSSSDPKLPFS